MSAARRLDRLERTAPPPASAPSVAHDADAGAARILALVAGDPLPDGPAPTQLERRAARILSIMAAAPMIDDDAEGGS